MQEEEKEERKRQLFANVMQVAVINKLLPQGFRFELIDTQAKLQDGYSQVKPVKRKKVSFYPQMVKSDGPSFCRSPIFSICREAMVNSSPVMTVMMPSMRLAQTLLPLLRRQFLQRTTIRRRTFSM
jgi:hypothetical protein